MERGCEATSVDTVNRPGVKSSDSYLSECLDVADTGYAGTGFWVRNGENRSRQYSEREGTKTHGRDRPGVVA